MRARETGVAQVSQSAGCRTCWSTDGLRNPRYRSAQPSRNRNPNPSQPQRHEERREQTPANLCVLRASAVVFPFRNFAPAATSPRHTGRLGNLRHESAVKYPGTERKRPPFQKGTLKFNRPSFLSGGKMPPLSQRPCPTCPGSTRRCSGTAGRGGSRNSRRASRFP